MKYAIDVSNYSGTPTSETVRAVVASQDLEHVIIACQFPDTFNAWYKVVSAYSDWMSMDAYRELYNDTPYTEQIRAAINVIGTKAIGTLWFGVEDEPPSDTLESQLLDCIKLCDLEELPCGIYTRREYWMRAGNPQLGRYVPLWDANYDGVAQNLPLVQPYGGWLIPAIKQYAANQQSYGLTFDLDVVGH